MGIVLKIAQNLLNVDYFWTGIPCNTAAHQIPLVVFLDGYTF